jgi:SUF system NifU family Fe-S assembly protein
VSDGLQELYQEVILDHNRRPRNFRIIAGGVTQEGHNPLCGDRVLVSMAIDNGVVRDVAFEGQGCAIAKASASLMTEALKGLTVAEAQERFAQFQSMVTSAHDEPPADPLIAGFQALGARQGISPALPAALNAWLSDVIAALPVAFGPDRDPVLAAAACRLADLGARLHPDHRLELVFDQVLRAPIPGQTHAERVWLACALNARYGGNAATPAPETTDRLLGEEARASARALGLAMRLGCDLSGRSPQLLANASITVVGGQLKLMASDGYADVLLGEQTRRRARALAEAMGLKLEI